jgi:5-bromo-4-chloroindolyl phosphate hydrolysis protein
VREPFIGQHEMFHVENMGTLAGHFTYLGRALERTEKKPSDLAHAHALAEELTRLIRLQMIEASADEMGVVKH